MHQERARLLDGALSRLPEHYRNVILWRHRDNRSFADIGRTLKRSPDAIRKLWARAIECLQRELLKDAK